MTDAVDTPQVRTHSVTRRAGAETGVRPDDLAVEEPLEIRVAGEPVAITMRTPGHDEWLTAGFLLSEGIIESLDDVSRIYHCGRPGTETFANTVDVVAAPGHVLDLERVLTARRGTLTTAACGVCGRVRIDDLVERCEPIVDAPAVAADVIARCVKSLRERQPVFDRTGGVHAAGIFDPDGQLIVCCEDIGRHNAVDKAVGALLYGEGEGRVPALLAVSGRASFEMVQKAVTARLAYVASVSAASTLAVSLAERAGVTLAGFVRGENLNLYAHPARVT